MTTLSPREYISGERLLEIFTDIAAGERNHGDFLKSFAEAYVRADPGNLVILMPTAFQLVRKYQLNELHPPQPPAATSCAHECGIAVPHFHCVCAKCGATYVNPKPPPQPPAVAA